MGQTSSLALGDGARLAVCRIEVHWDNNVGFLVELDSKKNEWITTCSDKLEFVYVGGKGLVVKIPADAPVKFELKIGQAPISNLTYVATHADTRSLDEFLSTELFHNPNLQREDNVVLLGDIDTPQEMQFVWSATNLGPHDACFAEYDRHSHKLKTLAQFSFYVGDYDASSSRRTSVASMMTSSTSAPLPPLPSPKIQQQNAMTSPSSSGSSSGSTITTGRRRSSNATPPAVPPKSNGNASTSTNNKPNAPPSHGVDPPVIASSPITNHQQHHSHNPFHTNGLRMSPKSHRISSPITTNSIRRSKSNLEDKKGRRPKSDVPASRYANSAEPKTPISADKTSQKLPHILTKASSQTPIGTSSSAAVAAATAAATAATTVTDPALRPKSELDPMDDGPLFRTTLCDLERNTGNVKMRIKKVLKRAEYLREKKIELAEAEALFANAVVEAARTDVPSLKPIANAFYSNGRPILVDSLNMSAKNLEAHVIEPMRRIYDQEIKLFDVRKREFDDTSSQYYAWMSRYLAGNNRKKDPKYLEKKRTFELCRFDYFTYMQDLHGGRKQQHVGLELCEYVSEEIDRFVKDVGAISKSVAPKVHQVVIDMKDANKDWARQRSDREDIRRTLERGGGLVTSGVNTTNPCGPTATTLSQQPVPLPMLNMSPGTKEATTRTLPTLRVVTADPNGSSDTFSDYDEHPITMCEDPATSPTVEYMRRFPSNLTINEQLESPIVDGNTTLLQQQQLPLPTSTSAPNDTKQGLLWSMFRQGWHKYWVVVANGKLFEYSNWKQGSESHNEPVDLKVACVREARLTDRRFCFEVVTPQSKRIYQATSDEDVAWWMAAINKGITTSLEQAASHNFASSPIIGANSSSAGGAGTSAGSTTGSASAITSGVPTRRSPMSTTPPTTGVGLGVGASPVKSTPVKPMTTALPTPKGSITGPDALSIPVNSGSTSVESVLRYVYSIHLSNQICADCGNSNSPEWISINLLAILCIDCSGVHRGLGSHVSKIRSLTLDTMSFNRDLLDLLANVSNAQINAIYEATLSSKPVISTLEARKAHIMQKYIEKKWIRPMDRPNSELRGAVADQNVVKAVAAIANRANVNLKVNDDGSNVCASTNSHSSAGSSSASDNVASPDSLTAGEPLIIYALRCAPSDALTFPLAELLLLNSATIPSSGPTPNNLSTAAVAYMFSRIKHDGGASTTNTSTSTSTNVPNNNAHVAISSTDNSPPPADKRGKVQKRLSFKGTKR